MNFRDIADLIPEWRAVGGLSSNSKMPGLSWGIPIAVCAARKIYLKIPHSVCSHCYCRKGFMNFPNSLNAQRRRLRCYAKDPDLWACNMHKLLARLYDLGRLDTMRWFDSGDLVDLPMLKRILAVGMLTPNYKHWISTQDENILRAAIDTGVIIPQNVTVRLTRHLILPPGAAHEPHKDSLPHRTNPSGVTYSAVQYAKQFDHDARTSCPAYKSSESPKCGECRKCWDRLQAVIVYPLH